MSEISRLKTIINKGELMELKIARTEQDAKPKKIDLKKVVLFSIIIKFLSNK